MSLAISQGVHTGNELVTYTRNGNGYFKGREVERAQVLGKERGGFVPLKIKKAEHEQAEYHIVRITTLQNYLASKKVSVNRDSTLALPVDIDVNKLWDADGILWEKTEQGIPHLKEGIELWTTFNTSRLIESLSTEKRNDTDLKLITSEPYHLSLIMSTHVPSPFYYHLDVFNWLLMQLKLKDNHS